MMYLILLLSFAVTVKGQGSFVEELERLGCTETVRYLGLTDLELVLEETDIGPHTLFAPTNDAWEKLPEETRLLLETNLDALELLLSHHIIPTQDIRAGDLSNDQIELSFIEVPIRFNTYANGALTASGAPISTADQNAANGVIHVTDMVMDIGAFTVFQNIQEHGNCNILAGALIETGLNAILNQEGPFTVFAPTDDAFDLLPDGVLGEILLDPLKLYDLLTYHVVGGTFFSAGLANGNVTTILGQDIEVNIDGGVSVNGNAVTEADTASWNGALHVIDGVLLPQFEEK